MEDVKINIEDQGFHSQGYGSTDVNSFFIESIRKRRQRLRTLKLVLLRKYLKISQLSLKKPHLPFVQSSLLNTTSLYSMLRQKKSAQDCSNLLNLTQQAPSSISQDQTQTCTVLSGSIPLWCS